MARKTLFQRIRHMDSAHQAVLAAYLCERLLPNYELFAKLTGTGEVRFLRGALNAVWDKLGTKQNTDWERWQEKLESVTPDAAEFDVLGVYPAIAACTAISCLLQGIADKETAPFLDVAKISQGSVAHYLELGEFADIEDADDRAVAIEEHPLMAYERETQDAMVEFLGENELVTKELVREVRAIARAEGHSNLGLS
ncbi:MAG: YjaG family protein [Idiomarina sp.]|nr:YjaG family protein [Idiomarina sp.]